MAAIDVTGYVASLKDHAHAHGFHIHDERQFIETYSLRQTWEVDLHPAEACGGPLDLHLTIEADPRTLLSFEDVLWSLPEDDLPPDEYWLPLTFTWALPPVDDTPDMLVLATDLAGLGGTALPVEVAAIDSLVSVTDPSKRTLMIVARKELSLQALLQGEDDMCEPFDLCAKICDYLLHHAQDWYESESA